MDEEPDARLLAGGDDVGGPFGVCEEERLAGAPVGDAARRVEDERDAARGPDERGGVREVAADDLDPEALEIVEAGSPAAERPHPVPAGDERGGQAPPDESRRAGDEDSGSSRDLLRHSSVCSVLAMISSFRASERSQK